MSAKVVSLPQIAKPTIVQVLEEFLSEQRKRLKPKTQKEYEDVIGLLRQPLNSYAYQGLPETEAALFDKYFNAKKTGIENSVKSSARKRSSRTSEASWAIS